VGRVIEDRLEIDGGGIRIDLVSMTPSLPTARTRPPLSWAVTLTSPCSLAVRIAASESDGSGNVTKMGSSWLMMTMPVLSVAFTMFPASISRVPARPSRGERMRL
jgi:hypothetical protein